MYFKEITIKNYKCFKNEVSFKFEKGINIVVGQNNVGKTSVLEAMGLNFDVEPHFNSKTFPNQERPPQYISEVKLTFTITNDELKDALLKRNLQNPFDLPLDFRAKSNSTQPSNWKKAWNLALGTMYANDFFSSEQFTFKIKRVAYEENNNTKWEVPDDAYVSPHFIRAEEEDGQVQYYVNFKIDNFSREIKLLDTHPVSGGGRSDFLVSIAPSLYDYLFSFRAERIPSEPCKLNKNEKLLPNAANLAEVIDSLNTKRRNKYNDLVKEIFPNIHQVGIKKVDKENNGRVVIWTDKDATDDNHLAFKLNKCGSGVGQVLAILYVIMTKESKVILIDEPQSFLHPNAARKLIEIIRTEGKHHQIVIATHSSTIITAANPQTVTLISQNGSESTISNIDIQKFNDLQAILSELGGRFSDVFGYDRVIWVEGQTEELCFPKIADKFHPLLGTAILRVQNTGDMEKNDNKFVERIVSIYERLSFANNGLVPTSIDFIFDKELRSDEKLKQLEKLGFNIQNRQCLHFTSKRQYENYLLNPEAIKVIVNEIDFKRDKEITLHQVKQWINKNKNEIKYYKNKKLPQNLKLWKNEIDAATFLQNLFSDLIQTEGINYTKTIHSVKLTEWILENAPNDLKEIAQIFELIINKYH